MNRIVDFHSHILPGIDDGSASVEESVQMLQAEAQQGIRHVVATPHFYANYDSPHHFLKRRAAAEQLLRESMQKYMGLPEVTVGAEVYYFPGISESELLLELTIGGKRCILIEMPHAPWTKAMYRELEGIYVKQGLTPVIAHVDRYISPFRTMEIPERLAELPVLVQANAEFFIQRSTSRMALRMLNADKIQLLGSDCHNLKDRIPNLGSALEKIQKKLGNEALVRIASYQKDFFGI